MTHHLLQPLVITSLVVTEVAVWQLRVALATRGRKRAAAALGATNAVLSVVALAQVVTHLERPANVAGYAVGVAVGVYLGIVVDERLSRDWLEYRLLVHGAGTELAEELLARGWRVTRQGVIGPSGPAEVVQVVIEERAAKDLEHDLVLLAPQTLRTTSRLMVKSLGSQVPAAEPVQALSGVE